MSKKKNEVTKAKHNKRFLLTLKETSDIEKEKIKFSAILVKILLLLEVYTRLNQGQQEKSFTETELKSHTRLKSPVRCFSL